MTFSGHVGVGDQEITESFTQSMSESMERNQQQNIGGKNISILFYSYQKKIIIAFICFTSIVNFSFSIEDNYVMIRMYRSIKINVFAIFELVFQYAREESYRFLERK